MNCLTRVLALAALIVTAANLHANAAVDVSPDPNQNWLGYMNVYNLPANGHGYQFGSPWGTQDLTATFTGDVLTLGPNVIGDPDPYWYTPSGGPGAQGNKEMHASFYVEDNATLPGELVNFTGEVLSNTLVDPYTAIAFIKDFAPDYSSFNVVSVPLTPGMFNLSLQTMAGGRHIQFGFETVGPNVWVTDVGSKGSVQLRSARNTTPAIPEPSSMVLLGSGVVGLLGWRRRKA